VQPVMSTAATGIIHPDALTYASGREAIQRISGMVEHVQYCGDEGTADLLLIAPCTANTLGKIAAGIDDTTVTTFATTAIGSKKPVLIVPAMHRSMYCHPAVAENIARLHRWGISCAEPRIEEGKAKIADTEEIVLRCERAVSPQPLKGKRVLITSGPCQEPVDDVRVLTTRSSGRIGRALALQAYRLGAEVTVVHRDTFPCVSNVLIGTAEEMSTAVHACFSGSGANIYISAAAISDFAPRKIEGKIPSGKKTQIDLDPLPKLLDEVAKKYSATIIAFKLGRDQAQKARDMLAKGTISMILVNEPETMGSEEGEYTLLTTGDAVTLGGTKDEIAAAVWEKLLHCIQISIK
ncbi:MAG: bifunctional phosphopantothenoylcysteine decarboxylase/phosphopantothenate--cysteine ligase CoaBC, partial [Methanomicrobiales archaeon]